MRATTYVLLLILLVLCGVYAYIWTHKPIPCVTPVSYGVMSVDEKLNLPYAEAEAIVTRAAGVWNQALNRDVFVESEKPDIPLYFINARLADHKQARYVSDEAGEKIYVYGFDTKRELERTVIHEFGHALGLEHVEDEEAIMNATTSRPNLTLTQSDIEEMNRVCAVKSS